MARRSLIGTIPTVALLPGPVLGQIMADTASREGVGSMRIRCTFSDQTFAAMLHDNASARDFAAMLPVELVIEDYSTNEKIAYLPRKLTEHGSGAFSNEAPGDLCYFAAWGNLAFFHAGYRYSSGLIRLGRLDDSARPLLKRGSFPLGIESFSQS